MEQKPLSILSSQYNVGKCNVIPYKVKSNYSNIYTYRYFARISYLLKGPHDSLL